MWLLCGITLAAAAVRLLHLGEWSLWVDEAHTWRDANMDLRIFLREERALYPLTFLGLRALLAWHWIGTDEYWLRLPFVLLGIASVPLVAICGRNLVGPGAAVLAAAFCAFDPWHVFWSQNARGYVLVFLFATLAANRAHAMAVTGRARDLLATFGAITLAALSHPSGYMVAVGVLAFAFWRRLPPLGRRQIVQLAVLAVVLVVGLPWLFLQLPFEGFVRSKGDPSLAHFVQTTAFYFRPVVLVLGAAGLLLLRGELGRDRLLLLACIWIVPVLGLAAIGAQIVKVTARYAICTLPVLLWLAAFAAVHVARRARAGLPRAAWLAAAAALPLLVFADRAVELAAYHGVQRGQRADWREACELAAARAARGRLRVLTVNYPAVLYYLRPRHWSVGLANPYPDVQVLPILDWQILGLDEKKNVLHEPGAENHLRWHLAHAVADGAAFVVMVTLPELAEEDHDGSLLRTLRRDFELVGHFSCWVGPKDESIHVYVPKGT